MGLEIESRIGKKYVIYLPKVVVEEIGLIEGMRILITVKGDKIIIEPLQDPVALALQGKKFTSLSVEELEAISLEEQSKFTENSS